MPMNRIWIALLAVLSWTGSRTLAAPPGAAPAQNLCYNGAFDNATNALDGWTYDYQWEGNSHYMANHTRVSALPSYNGRSKVLFMNATAETKVESKPIPFEKGARYQCTLEVAGTTMPHIYFVGYKWNPGVRPGPDPHIGDLRKIYKSEFRNHKVTGSGAGWSRVTFEFPLPNLSSLALDHLKQLRFITVYVCAVDGSAGQVYLDNVEVKKIR